MLFKKRKKHLYEGCKNEFYDNIACHKEMLRYGELKEHRINLVKTLSGDELEKLQSAEIKEIWTKCNSEFRFEKKIKKNFPDAETYFLYRTMKDVLSTYLYSIHLFITDMLLLDKWNHKLSDFDVSDENSLYYNLKSIFWNIFSEYERFRKELTEADCHLYYEKQKEIPMIGTENASLAGSYHFAYYFMRYLSAYEDILDELSISDKKIDSLLKNKEYVGKHLSESKHVKIGSSTWMLSGIDEYYHNRETKLLGDIYISAALITAFWGVEGSKSIDERTYKEAEIDFMIPLYYVIPFRHYDLDHIRWVIEKDIR